MNHIKIFKAASLPETIQPSSIYFIKNTATGRMVIYLSDKDGQLIYRSYDDSDISSIVMVIINALKDQPGGLVGLDLNGQLIGNIISRIDGQNTAITTGENNDLVWADLREAFVIKSFNGGNNPSFGSWNGNMQGLLFSGSTMNQVWVDFHIGHDIALNTKIYPHVHWMPLVLGVGSVRWGFEYTIAKGHTQMAFGPTTTVYVDHDITGIEPYTHLISEVSDTDAILSDAIEPDTVIKFRIFRAANTISDTHPFSIHAWQSDLHHQISQLGTRNKKPNFFA